jgi:hypothetical protein
MDLFRKADYVENDLFWACSSFTMSKTQKICSIDVGGGHLFYNEMEKV